MHAIIAASFSNCMQTRFWDKFKGCIRHGPPCWVFCQHFNQKPLLYFDWF